MSIVFQKFQPFVEKLAKGTFNLTSDATCTPTIALCAAANPPANTNAVLADLTEIAYTNLSSRVVTVTSCSQTSGTLKWILQDLTLTATGDVAAFQYIVLYDADSVGSSLIGYFDYGSEITLHNGDSVVLGFDASTGAISIV